MSDEGFNESVIPESNPGVINLDNLEPQQAANLALGILQKVFSDHICCAFAIPRSNPDPADPSKFKNGIVVGTVDPQVMYTGMAALVANYMREFTNQAMAMQSQMLAAKKSPANNENGNG